MVLIPIPDEVWQRVRLSWILFGVHNEQELMKMVVDDLLDKSNSVIQDAEEHPENYETEEICKFKQEIERLSSKKSEI